MTTRLFACFVLAALSMGAHAQSATYYRWKDASGATHYGDAPPAGSKAEAVSVKTGQGVSRPAAPPADPATHASNAATGALAAADVAAKARNCDAAKHNLAIVGSGGMLVDSSDPANAKRLSAEQVERARRSAQDDVTAYCSGGAN